MSAAAGTSDSRYRHVVFTATPKRPLDLGFAPVVRTAPEGGVVHRTPAARRVSPASEEDAFLGWLFRQADLGARSYRGPALRRRLPACFRALRVDGIANARRALRRNPQLVPVALDALLLGVTEFFRDAPVFDRLAREMSAAATSRRPLRVWSAGCSDGAELYSVAMMLEELGLGSGAELLGTDCRPKAIAHAVTGSFSRLARHGLSDERLRRHFDEPDHDGRASVTLGLRKRIAWRRADVLAGSEPGPWDVILCRNLSMYLRPPAAERLWRALVTVLTPHGLLVTGKAERPSIGAGTFLPAGPCVYRRGGDR